MAICNLYISHNFRICSCVNRGLELVWQLLLVIILITRFCIFIIGWIIILAAFPQLVTQYFRWEVAQNNSYLDSSCLNNWTQDAA